MLRFITSSSHSDLHLEIQNSFLFSFLALELRSVANKNDVWFVAWSGSASSTNSDIQIAPQFAECINLPDRTIVRVRAIHNVPKAKFVTIEPDTEDDWEVLELNAEHAEAAILKQAGIVHEAMRFPLWLHGHTTITFSVVSTDPKEPIEPEAASLPLVGVGLSTSQPSPYTLEDVQLVPGTEVSVAPKRRRKSENSTVKALLRIQDADNRFNHKSRVNDTEIGLVLTSAAFIHPETANSFFLDSLQPVIIEQKLIMKEKKLNHENAIAKDIENVIQTDKKDNRQVVVRLLISDSVAKGHLMISQSLRYYLRAGLHSKFFFLVVLAVVGIHVKTCNVVLQKDPPSFVLSPCQFKIFGKKDFTNWSNHERITTLFANESDHQDKGTKSSLVILRAWILAEIDVISSFSKTELNSIVLGNNTLLHFQVKSTELTKYAKPHEIRKRAGESLVDIMYVLSFSGGSMQAERHNELSFSEGTRCP
ncbi:peroxisome biogenesis protein 1 isoform X1 [Tanacetum coccineum]